MANSAPQTPRELSSWKEIAGFLGVAVRTVQKWERERGLPVKRLPGKRGMVYADPAELLAWKKATPAATTARGRMALAVVLAVVLVAAAVSALRPWSRKSHPAGCRIEGKILMVFDQRGREIWRKVFPRHADPFHYPPHPGAPRKPRALFEDLDGDGRVETLFLHHPLEAEYAPDGTVLYCLSDTGAEKWRFVPGRKVSTRIENFDRPFLTQAFGVLTLAGGRGKAVVISSSHLVYHPNQVALLSPQGKLLGEYWHSGWLMELAVADVDGDGRTEIWLGGISNGYKAGALVVLDQDRVAGASAEENADYQLQGFAPAQEKGRALFPRSCINRKFRPYPQVSWMVASAGSTRVRVFQGDEGRPTEFNYELDARLNVRNFGLGDGFPGNHAKLRAEGKLDHDFSPKEEAEMGQIRVLRRP